jgi:hypothetical protein
VGRDRLAGERLLERDGFHFFILEHVFEVAHVSVCRNNPQLLIDTNTPADQSIQRGQPGAKNKN